MNPIFRIATAAMGLVMAAMATSQTASYDQHVAQAQADLKAGNPAQALTMSQKAIAAAPSRWEAYVVAGGALQAQQQYDEAADDFSKALERAPDAKKTALRALLESCILAEGAAQPSATPPAMAPALAAQSPVQTEAASPPQAPLAAAPPSSAPPVAETLAWISQHLNAYNELPYTFTIAKSIGIKKAITGTQQNHVSTTMSFQGCIVFFTQATTKTTLNQSTGDIFRPTTYANAATLNLSEGVPDKIAAGPNPDSRMGDFQLTIPFSQLFLAHNDKNSEHYTDILTIVLPTQEAANRQAKAWRDAIIDCKTQAAPAAPENLY